MANTPVFTMRLSPDLKARLAAEAERQRRSLSNMVEILLDEHLPPLQAGKPVRQLPPDPKPRGKS